MNQRWYEQDTYPNNNFRFYRSTLLFLQPYIQYTVQHCICFENAEIYLQTYQPLQKYYKKRFYFTLEDHNLFCEILEHDQQIWVDFPHQYCLIVFLRGCHLRGCRGCVANFRLQWSPVTSEDYHRQESLMLGQLERYHSCL